MIHDLINTKEVISQIDEDREDEIPAEDRNSNKSLDNDFASFDSRKRPWHSILCHCEDFEGNIDFVLYQMAENSVGI